MGLISPGIKDPGLIDLDTKGLGISLDNRGLGISLDIKDLGIRDSETVPPDRMETAKLMADLATEPKMEEEMKG